jgi:hypothetical protein
MNTDEHGWAGYPGHVDRGPALKVDIMMGEHCLLLGMLLAPVGSLWLLEHPPLSVFIRVHPW